MTDYMLTLARPGDPADCLAEPVLASFLQAPPWVAYLTYGGLYLSDANDVPRLENEYETGLDLWATSVRTLLATLSRWSGGVFTQISFSRRQGLSDVIDKVTGRTAPGQWKVQSNPSIDPELVQSMATYGWEATIWTTLRGSEAAAISQAPVATRDLRQLLLRGTIPWWCSHGYKEPFLAGHTPSLAMAAVADLVRENVGLPVQVTEAPFVPHRVRLHRRLIT